MSKLQYIIHPELEDVKVSIITPVFNVEEYITETLESLVNQTLDHIEIIMVDDGSSDRSPEIVEEYANKYRNIVFIKQENSGPGVARNNGLEVARGEFISFVDSDDLLPLDALETMYYSALKEKADIVLGTSLSFNSTETWFIASHVNNGVYVPGEKSLVANPGLLFSLGPCNKLYHSKIVTGIRFPADIHVTEDQPFVIEAYMKANKIYTVDKIIYKYRSREAEENLSLSQTVRVNSVKVLTDIFKSMRISDQLWDKYIPNKRTRFALKKSYYTRIVSADIWPAIRSALVSKDQKTQVESFTLVLEWVKTLDYHLFNEIPPLHRIMTYEIADRYKLVSPAAKKLYLQWLKVCFSKLDPGSLHVLETSKKQKVFMAVKKAWKRNSLSPIFFYLVKVKSKKIKSKVKTALVRRVAFPFFSTLPVQKKITMATNKFPRLTDSFEHIYDELINERPDYKIRGHFKKKRNFRDFCRLYYDIATSRYLILDDYYRPLYKLRVRKQTEVIQTWHAAGAFKKFGHSAVGYRESNSAQFERSAHQIYTKAVVTSKEIIPHYAEAFEVPEENIYSLGLPRTDVFFDKDLMEFVHQRYLGTYPKLKNKKVITYAPTFRGGPGKRANFNIKLDLVKMAEELSDEYVLILKLHPSVTKKVKIPEEAADFVINMSSNEINNVLMNTDILISDYSSLVFEFSLLERPMIFFAYDLDEYLEDRGFYYEYSDFVPGPIVKTTDEVIKTVKENQFDYKKIESFKHRFFDELDGESAKRFVDILIKP
ncbi:CDP-glycerol glycerophosphotransferase family protein [Bacillus sp. ISL-7]|uniref:bifunctional glycosyltransferase/CDP-glycerol:glycerophosphate glycerophosphotransferase n=1 Tax=Bacillus sp. ISL-7 TaxID=2819136 RepID=UPI001BE795AC|nr:CDP-glycerol glycerophosphotransferase family protein [Bacillus sp. ISL-7]MBT2734681.1 CDP-glycerol glycerophosphotransferase family protein [Bacillus sp. ISL-7]